MNNRNGVDASYFAGKLALVVAGIDSYTPQELARELARLAKTADEEAAAGEFTHPAPSQPSLHGTLQEVASTAMNTNPTWNPSQPSAEALVQAALGAAIRYHDDAAVAELLKKGRPDLDKIHKHEQDAAAIRALSAQQIIESCKEKS